MDSKCFTYSSLPFQATLSGTHFNIRLKYSRAVTALPSPSCIWSHRAGEKINGAIILKAGTVAVAVRAVHLYQRYNLRAYIYYGGRVGVWSVLRKRVNECWELRMRFLTRPTEEYVVRGISLLLWWLQVYIRKKIQERQRKGDFFKNIWWQEAESH